MSPHTRRRLVRQATNGTPSSGSSRNESPRFTRDTESQYGVVKLKKSAARHNPNRNSTSFQTSTLQEDLLKLIGQDYEKVPNKTKVFKIIVERLITKKTVSYSQGIFFISLNILNFQI